MKITDLLDGRDANRQRLFCLIRRNYIQPLDDSLINEILSIAKKHGTQIDLTFNSNFLNPLYLELDGYSIFHEKGGRINKVTKRNWGNHYQFLLDLCDLGLIIKVSFSDEESGAKMYVLGKDAEILKEYISEERDV